MFACRVWTPQRPSVRRDSVLRTAVWRGDGLGKGQRFSGRCWRPRETKNPDQRSHDAPPFPRSLKDFSEACGGNSREKSTGCREEGSQKTTRFKSTKRRELSSKEKLYSHLQSCQKAESDIISPCMTVSSRNFAGS